MGDKERRRGTRGTVCGTRTLVKIVGQHSTALAAAVRRQRSVLEDGLS